MCCRRVHQGRVGTLGPFSTHMHEVDSTACSLMCT